jgi:hypothetical protein
MNVHDSRSRLKAARAVAARPPAVSRTEEVNNHVHTTFSFSPYSPTAAVWAAREAGLSTVGIVDHDSVAGAREFREAGDILGVPTTTGFEMRVFMAETSFPGRRFNSPDVVGMAYIVCHGLPHSALAQADELLAPVRASRERRNTRMVARLNDLISAAGLAPLSYEKNVRPLSEIEHGGTVTERHIMYALAREVTKHVAAGEALVQFLQSKLQIEVPAGQVAKLSDPGNPHLLYDLLGVLKSEFVPRIYEEPDGEECPPVSMAVDRIREIGAVPCYPYLGDITASVTGDKKAQAFEDAFLDELFPEIVRLGFRAVTYMPPRNTLEHLHRVQRLCAEHDIVEISGVDVNTSRQVFGCPETTEPDFRHLGDAAWALIEHERAVEEGGVGLLAEGGRAAVETFAGRARERFANGEGRRRRAPGGAPE